MKIVKLEAFPVRVPYRHVEQSSVVARAGVTDVVVKLTADNGLVGWGETTRAADAAGIDSAVKAMAPVVLGRDPWEREPIQKDVYVLGLWNFQPMTANFAYAGIDMAMWDLCGKQAGQPLYRLLGGALREMVDYFYYLHWGDAAEIEAQAKEGLARGYTVFYLKVGADAAAEAAMLGALRRTIGASRKIRIDANMAWSVPEAARILADWHARFDIDFVEAPVEIDPVENMLELKRRVDVPLCANEGLWRAADAYRLIKSRCCDYLCFSPYWVGSIGRFHALAWAAHLEGLLVCKHTHGELGLAAAAGQHLMLAAPNAAIGNQQTAQMMEDDILAERLPISDGARWGRIEGPGLGVSVDEAKLKHYHEAYRNEGEFPPYGDRFSVERHTASAE
jgi:L-alanine-DL-glutamate epimerase-like enolase superfamily enzyme